MTPQPGVPDDPEGGAIDLPCGETITADELDLGMREFECACGGTHAVVMDPHPPTRFLPTEVAEDLAATVTPAGTEVEEFGTVALMGLVMDALDEEIVAYDAAEDGTTGFAVAWIATSDARELHKGVVESVLSVMAEAVTDAGDAEAEAAFAEHRAAFDVEAFVDEYRAVRDFEDEFDEPV
ncbi:MAG: DUF5815 family protein [Halodesulfurarchaeum sp.]